MKMLIRLASALALGPSLCGLVLAHLAHAEEALTAREIMQRVNDRDDGDNATADLEMILIDKRGMERRRDIRVYTKDYGDDVHQVIFFLSPADVQDTGFLTYDYDGVEQDDDQWLYLPALRKTKRIASADQSGSFLGSDFAYADLSRRPLERYDFEIMKETEVRGAKAWQILATPKTQSEIDRTGYTKSVVFVLQDNYVVVRAANWLDKGNKVKYFDVTTLEKVDGVWVNMLAQMTTKRGKETLHKTILRTASIVFDQGHSDSVFTTRQLEKGP